MSGLRFKCEGEKWGSGEKVELEWEWSGEKREREYEEWERNGNGDWDGWLIDCVEVEKWEELKKVKGEDVEEWELENVECEVR